jgi:hypothetical protein
VPVEVRAAEGKVCPLHKKDMSEVCHKCPWWTQLKGKNPNTGQPVDEWACSISFLPVLLCENSQESRQTGAAVESFRNEMVKANQLTNNLLMYNVEAAKNITGNDAKLITGGESK